jgi:hypothetical protein
MVAAAGSLAKPLLVLLGRSSVILLEEGILMTYRHSNEIF